MSIKDTSLYQRSIIYDRKKFNSRGRRCTKHIFELSAYNEQTRSLNVSRSFKLELTFSFRVATLDRITFLRIELLNITSILHQWHLITIFHCYVKINESVYRCSLVSIFQ